MSNSMLLMGDVDCGDARTRIAQALDLIFKYGQIEGEHHKAWVVDQITRTLCKDKYAEFVADYCENDRYNWDQGIPP